MYSLLMPSVFHRLACKFTKLCVWLQFGGVYVRSVCKVHSAAESQASVSADMHYITLKMEWMRKNMKSVVVGVKSVGAVDSWQFVVVNDNEVAQNNYNNSHET